MEGERDRLSPVGRYKPKSDSAYLASSEVSGSRRKCLAITIEYLAIRTEGKIVRRADVDIQTASAVPLHQLPISNNNKIAQMVITTVSKVSLYKFAIPRRKSRLQKVITTYSSCE